MDKINFCTLEQGNFLIRLLLAHILSDFILQSDKMAKEKAWLSPLMLGHIFIVAASTFILTFSWKITLAISISHYVIDSVKIALKNGVKKMQFRFFTIDQFFHFLTILGVCIYKFGLFYSCFDSLKFLFLNYKFTLYLLAYATVVWPMGYLIKFFLEKIMPQDATDNVEHGGRLIGQFERIIILTFVLLSQYEAIGFLITGKSIIRFADRNSEVKSEYVLVGTMMSYAFSILIGLGIKWLVNY